MPTSPPSIAVYKSATADGVAPSFANATFKAGDWVYVVVLTAESTHKMGTPSGPPVGNPGWTSVQSVSLADLGGAYIWYAKVTADWTGTISVPITTQGISGFRQSLFRAYRYDSRSNGIGASASGFNNGAVSLSLTTQAVDSTILWAAVDWNASAWSGSPSFRVPSGTSAAINDGHANTSTFNWVFGRHEDAGPAGAKVVGLTAPATWKYTVVAVEVLADTTAPGVVPNISAAWASETSNTITWGAATDNSGIASYKVYDNDVEIADIPVASPRSYLHTGLALESTHNYRVRAVDTSGNLGGSNTVYTITMPAQKLKVGAAVANFKVGSTQVDAVYLGSTKLWP